MHFETEELFKEFFCNFLAGNIKYIEKVCGREALAVCKTEIARRQSENWKYKYDDILDTKHPIFLGGHIPDKSTPCFTFTIEV